jgi:hypothetical protein
MAVLKFVAHGKDVIRLATGAGWRPGARYTNLRDVRHARFERFGFLDIHWKKYSFDQHLKAAEKTRPYLTVARDIECSSQLSSILDEAHQLSSFAKHVIIVPKDVRLADRLSEIPDRFVLGYSVPTRYGGTAIPAEAFGRPTHLLGGRPDIQRRLAEQIPVVSIDCNRFTLDARYGDFFDGARFRPHPVGGYQTCLAASIANIDELWSTYVPPEWAA